MQPIATAIPPAQTLTPVTNAPDNNDSKSATPSYTGRIVPTVDSSYRPRPIEYKKALPLPPIAPAPQQAHTPVSKGIPTPPPTSKLETIPTPQNVPTSNIPISNPKKSEKIVIPTNVSQKLINALNSATTVRDIDKWKKQVETSASVKIFFLEYDGLSRYWNSSNLTKAEMACVYIGDIAVVFPTPLASTYLTRWYKPSGVTATGDRRKIKKLAVARKTASGAFPTCEGENFGIFELT